MGKFVIRAGSGQENKTRPANAIVPKDDIKGLTRTKRASVPGKATAANKRAKPSQDGALPRTQAWAKVRMVPVPNADYQDQTLAFVTLRDGRELLIGAEVWELPEGSSASSPAPLKDLRQMGKMPGDRFAPLPGLDAVAVVARGATYFSQRLCICALPGGEEVVAQLDLPSMDPDGSYGGKGYIMGLHAAPAKDGNVSLLVVTRERLFLFTVRPEEGDGTRKLAYALDTHFDLEAKSGAPPIAAELGLGPHVGPQATGLYVDPAGARYALLGSRGNVHVAFLDGDAAGARSVAVVHAHTPMKKTDREAIVFDLALWPSDTGCSLLSVGTDGLLCRTQLDDGTSRLQRKDMYPDDYWYASASGSGPSKQYRFAPAHRVSVCAASGVAMTGSQFESVAHLWDLRSTKSSSKGKKLCTTPRLASGTPSKVKIMCVAASNARGLLAYSNSNNAEDATLKLIVPCAK